jgi:hypothetical protein
MVVAVVLVAEQQAAAMADTLILLHILLEATVAMEHLE